MQRRDFLVAAGAIGSTGLLWRPPVNGAVQRP
jgi:hypothetical protein